MLSSDGRTWHRDGTISFFESGTEDMDVFNDVAPLVLVVIAAIYKWVRLNRDQRSEFIGIAGYSPSLR